MARTTGIVIRTFPDSKADVVADKQGNCAACSSAHSCQASHAPKKMTTTVINPIGAEPGDLVAIDVNTGRLLKGLALIYLPPVFGLLTGAIVGVNVRESLEMTETGSAILFGGIGLVLGFGLVVAASKFMAAGDAFTPVINRIVRKGAIKPVRNQTLQPVSEGCPGNAT